MAGLAIVYAFTGGGPRPPRALVRMPDGRALVFYRDRSAPSRWKCWSCAVRAHPQAEVGAGPWRVPVSQLPPG